ncbi:MADF domain [Cinara cedri]|uniref:MADF domain n=1 Tax=Cinara cedri TaxID=506608 RepID=A0A5E4NLK8_9HEMI|nr:MADF domain [Cinara cedri]
MSTINVRFDEDTTLRFVKLYRDQRLLWDKGHESYNKRADRLNAYRRIVDEMAIDKLGVSEVVSKIKSIRSTYQQEVQKIRASAQSDKRDADAASPYVPRVQWFPIMDAMIGGSEVDRFCPSPSADGKTVSRFLPVNAYLLM